MDIICFVTFIKWQKCWGIFANQPVISGFLGIVKLLMGIEPASRKPPTIATNPHFQLLQLEALFAILATKEISSWPARLFISPDCQIATEK